LLLGKATIFDMGEGLKRLNLARSSQSQVGTSLFSFHSFLFIFSKTQDLTDAKEKILYK